MNKKEVIDLIKIIDRSYKTDYAGDGDIVNDWYKVLKEYELADVTKVLDKFMRFNTNYPPKVYDLTRNIITIEMKKRLDNAKIRCQFCGEVINLDNTEHEERCLSIQFIKSAVRKFKGQEIDTERYKKMNSEEFNKYHLSAVKLVIEKSNNKLEVANWKKYLESLK